MQLDTQAARDFTNLVKRKFLIEKIQLAVYDQATTLQTIKATTASASPIKSQLTM